MTTFFSFILQNKIKPFTEVKCDEIDSFVGTPKDEKVRKYGKLK